MENEENKKKKKITHVLIGTGIGTVLIGGFLFWYFKLRKGVKNKKNDDLFTKLSEQSGNYTSNSSSNTSSQNQQTIYHPPINSGFPLKRGSTGTLVKQLQEALIMDYGNNIMPKYGADGDFGSETIKALTSKGFPTVIDKTTFDKIVSGATTTSNTSSKDASTTTTFNNSPLPASVEQPIDIAKNIWQHTKEKNLDGLISELQRIDNVKDYVITNTLFKTLYLRGVHQTIVNASLSSFDDDTSKGQIRTELLRIGLKNRNNKWSLAGLNGKQLVTKQITTIRSMDGLGIEVPAETLLGYAIGNTNEVTAFKTLDNETLYVPTKHVNHV